MAEPQTAGRRRPWHPTRLYVALRDAGKGVDVSDEGTEECVMQLHRGLVDGEDVYPIEDQWKDLFALVLRALHSTNVKFVARLTDDIDELAKDLDERIRSLPKTRANAREALCHLYGRLEAVRRLLSVVLLDLEENDRLRRIMTVLRQAGYWDLVVDMHANGGRTAHAIANGRSVMRTHEIMDVLVDYGIMQCLRSMIDVPEAWQNDFYEVGDVGRALVRLEKQDRDHSAG